MNHNLLFHNQQPENPLLVLKLIYDIKVTDFTHHLYLGCLFWKNEKAEEKMGLENIEGLNRTFFLQIFYEYFGIVNLPRLNKILHTFFDKSNNVSRLSRNFCAKEVSPGNFMELEMLWTSVNKLTKVIGAMIVI